MHPLLTKSLLAATLISAFCGTSLHAQTTTNSFGSGSNAFSLDFQTIGNAGNAADTTGYGAVGYNYSIGTYDISQSNVDDAILNGVVGIAGVSTDMWTGNKPATGITWYQAAAFVNWLDTSTGHQEAYNLTYSGGAYTMALWQSGDSGYDPSNPYRNSLALYVLPSVDEWYKAAYYDPSSSSYNAYPTGSNAPTAVSSGTDTNTAVFSQSYAQGPASVFLSGGLSAYGTMGQGGNVAQMLETAYGGSNTDPTAARWFSSFSLWYFSSDYMQSGNLDQGFGIEPGGINEDPAFGFRVAEITANAVPEPSTYALFILGGVALLIGYRRGRAI